MADNYVAIQVSVSFKPMDDDNLKNHLFTKRDAIECALRDLERRLATLIPAGSSCQVLVGEVRDG